MSQQNASSPNPSTASLLEGNTAVVGLQWGDEGKGKIVDVLSEGCDVVARWCGGANAGHSVHINGQKFATHLLPVGVFRKNVISYIGNGVVLDPAVLLKEIDQLTAAGVPVTPDRLRISYKTHVVMPYHMLEDSARESSAEGTAIGTTRRGIGPTYADKMQRATAVRVADLVRPDVLKQKLPSIVTERNKVLAALYGSEPINVGPVLEQYIEYGRRLEPYVDDIGYRLLQDRQAGRKIVYEGAHAVLLDIDHGTYPYVTSSSCSSLGLFTGTGVPPQSVKNYVGVLKAYCTRVGGGPFPTELQGDLAHAIREKGREYGTTTGRPRRIGWLDTMAARYATDLCGCTAIALTLLDVLGDLPELKICTGYEIDGKPLPYFRADMDTLARVTPVFETLKAWKGELIGCKTFDDLPAEAKAYIARIEELVGVPVKLVSVGPGREAILSRVSERE